jgi:maleate cis-trans isomerase
MEITGKPVVTGNQATIWRSLPRARGPIRGPGRLLETA